MISIINILFISIYSFELSIIDCIQQRNSNPIDEVENQFVDMPIEETNELFLFGHWERVYSDCSEAFYQSRIDGNTEILQNKSLNDADFREVHRLSFSENQFSQNIITMSGNCAENSQITSSANSRCEQYTSHGEGEFRILQEGSSTIARFRLDEEYIDSYSLYGNRMWQDESSFTHPNIYFINENFFALKWEPNNEGCSHTVYFRRSLLF